VVQGQSYTYHVRAINKLGGTDSADLNVSVPVPAPAAPTTIKVSGTSGKVTVSWNDKSKNELGFHVYKSVDGGEAVLVATVKGKSWKDTAALAVGSTASYYVKAYNAGGESASSPVSSVTGVESKKAGAAKATKAATRSVFSEVAV
jgi:hypothetical protein